MPKKNLIKNTFSLFMSTLFIEISRLVKFNLILGSQTLFFSAVNIMTPLIGVFGGISTGLRVYIIQCLIKGLMLGGSFIPYIGYHIPHLFASAYWNYESKLIKIALPLVCMVLFIIHPVGAIAWSYSMLWLVPIIISLIKKQSIFLKALGSTFTAHAVGSVFWIYSTPMTPFAWIALIPVAIVERIIFALGIFIAYHAYFYIKALIQNQLKLPTVFLKIKHSIY